jgi:hypothetical protein
MPPLFSANMFKIEQEINTSEIQIQRGGEEISG